MGINEKPDYIDNSTDLIWQHKSLPIRLEKDQFETAQ